MLWKFEASNLLKEFELSNNPVIVTVNKFDEQAAEDFRNKFSMAQNTGQKVVPVVIDSYGGQVYSLMSMIGNIKAAERLLEIYPDGTMNKIYLPHPPQTVDVPYVRVAPDLELPMQQILPESELQPIDLT